MIHNSWAGAQLRTLDDADCKVCGGLSFFFFVLHRSSSSTLGPQALAAANVTELHLHGNHLQRLPPAFNTLALSSLDLSGNRLSAVPESLLQLAGLERLKLRGNRIQELPALAGAWPLLASLDVGENDLSTLAGVAGLTMLATLAADNNTGLGDAPGPVVIQSLPALVALDLRKCRLRLVPRLEHLPLLEDLTLRSNSIEHVPDDALAALPSLISLDLADNKVLSLDHVRLPASLRALNVSYNRLAALPHIVLLPTGSPSLIETLAASNNALQALDDALLRMHVRLRELNVSHNRLRAIPRSVVCESPALAVLLASHNHIEQLDVDVTPALRQLDVKGNPLTFAQVQPLIEREFAGTMDLCHFYETVPQCIEEDLFLGSAEAARNFPVLRRLRICHILNAAMPESQHRVQVGEFDYLTLHLEDNDAQNISEAFERAHSYIDAALAKPAGQRGVLIHCQGTLLLASSLFVSRAVV